MRPLMTTMTDRCHRGAYGAAAALVWSGSGVRGSERGSLLPTSLANKFHPSAVPVPSGFHPSAIRDGHMDQCTGRVFCTHFRALRCREHLSRRFADTTGALVQPAGRKARTRYTMRMLSRRCSHSAEAHFGKRQLAYVMGSRSACYGIRTAIIIHHLGA